MEALELIDIISMGETSTVQFKRTLYHDSRLAAEICALANSSGGNILFGVEDDGSISGLSSDEIGKLNSSIANVASNNIREPIFPTSEVVKVDNKNVLIVKINESRSKPHFDQSGAIWVKNLSDKRRVTSKEELRRIFQNTHVLYADEQVVPRSTFADLDIDAFLSFYNRAYDESLETSAEIEGQLLENLNIVRNGSLSLAGLMFFSKNPQRFRPEFSTKAVAYIGTDPTGTRYRDSEDLTGTLPQQLAKAKAFLSRNLNHVQRENSFNSEGNLEIPTAALEELLVNMLVHRNYFISAPQKLFIFDDRVEMHSPGCLTNTLTIEQIKLGNSIPRNPVIHGFASRILPYRGIGTGIRRAIRLYPAIDLNNDITENRFRVILSRK